MTKEALKLALEALELHGKQYPHMVKGYCLDAITAIKEALAQPEQEYHAVNAVHKGQQCYVKTQPKEPEQKPMHPQLKAMLEEYFDKCFAESAPQRTWVGLTEKDICEATVKSQEGISPHDDTLRFAIAIEAKLKEKNT